MLKGLLAGIFSLITKERNFLFDKGFLPQYSSQLPVVSVGNLTAGGNGKTPLVMFLADRLQQRGYIPCILSRGYGGSEAGPYQVSDSDLARKVGDEPLMMAKALTCPVVIARKRVAGAKFIEKNKLGNCIILDDGFQHRWLARDVDILSIDVSTPLAREEFKEGSLLPLGLFREGRKKGLERATTVVLSHRSLHRKAQDADPAILALIPESASVFRSHYTDITFRSMQGDQRQPSGDVILVTGIANPEGFRQSIETKGYSVTEFFSYPDHHNFTQDELGEIRKRFPNNAIITTQKDFMRIGSIDDQNWFYTEAKFSVYPEDAFLSHILKQLNR